MEKLEMKYYHFFILFVALLVINICLNNSSLIIKIPIFIIVALIYYYIIMSGMKKITSYINNECDPKKYITVYNKRLLKKLRNNSINELAILGNAFILSGEINSAKINLDLMNQLPIKSINNKILYYYCQSLFYLEVKNFSSASIALNQLEEALTYARLLPSAAKKNYESYILRGRYLINISNNNYEGAVEYFNTCFLNVKQNLTKVLVEFSLGEIYMHFERYNEAKEAFEYVVQNGNTLYKVQLAKEYLKRISCQQNEK
ncbi:MAG: hypothetical protein Q8876_01495 [Bacillota bacterium]|nr:hypothetical protein [Bacillota bacterium]